MRKNAWVHLKLVLNIILYGYWTILWFVLGNIYKTIGKRICLLVSIWNFFLIYLKWVCFRFQQDVIIKVLRLWKLIFILEFIAEQTYFVNKLAILSSFCKYKIIWRNLYTRWVVISRRINTKYSLLSNWLRYNVFLWKAQRNLWLLRKLLWTCLIIHRIILKTL